MTAPRSCTAALVRSLRLASAPSVRLGPGLAAMIPRHLASQRSGIRLYTTDGTTTTTTAPANSIREPPPLLKALKEDLKTAMRAKDKIRLSAIRGVLAAVTNRDKMGSPVTRDEHLVGLMRKQIQAMEEAAAEFKAASRDDLVEKEEATIQHLATYIAASGVEELSGDALMALVRPVVENGVKNGQGKGQIMKDLLHSGADKFEGKTVVKKDLSDMVSKVLGELDGERIIRPSQDSSSAPEKP